MGSYPAKSVPLHLLEWSNSSFHREKPSPPQSFHCTTEGMLNLEVQNKLGTVIPKVKFPMILVELQSKAVDKGGG